MKAEMLLVEGKERLWTPSVRQAGVDLELDATLKDNVHHEVSMRCPLQRLDPVHIGVPVAD